MDNIKRFIQTVWRIAVCCGVVVLLAIFLSSCATGETADQGEQDSASAPDAGNVVSGTHNGPASSEEIRPSGDADAESAGLGESGGGASSGTVRIAADGFEAAIVLEDSEAARAFAGLMPLELEMRDMNGNEKFAYLDEPLPSAAQMPGRIQAGDVMLYGDSCIVVFYESFDTPYSYTRIGRIDDPAAIEAIADATSLRVAFSAM